MIIPNNHIVKIISLSLFPVMAQSYASWFVNQAISCYRDFKPGEVIMNNEIIDASKSRYPNIRLAQVSSNDKLEEIDFEGGQEFTLILTVPYDGVHDLQYVVEADDGGKMVGVGSGCEGRRASARNGETVTLSLSGAVDTVKVWAGWATSHEAVTLTPPLIFKKKGTSTQKKEQQNNKKKEDYPEPKIHISPHRSDPNANEPNYHSKLHDINPLHHSNIKNKLRISKQHLLHHKRTLHIKHAQFLEFASDSPFLANLSIAALVMLLLIIFVKNCGGAKEKKGKHEL